jgi:hypothetical protein
MKISDINLNQQILSNPLTIQSLMINDFETRLNGTYSIADVNNTFALMTEYASTIAANAIAQTENRLTKVYPVRALAFEDLWPHMSDYDYVNFFATPASTVIYFTLNKDYLLQSAIPYNQYYKKVVIPKETVITIGKYSFGLYYPVELRLNTETNKFIALFDTTINNPLHKLSNNTLESIEQRFDTMNLLIMKIPIYQFDCTKLTGEVIPNLGYNKTYKIQSGKFYAARIFNTNRVLNTRQELKQTMSEEVYDPYVPTAKIKINPDENTVNISIPRIYMINNLCVGTIEVELYTTEGAITLDFTNLDFKTIKVDYKLKITPNKYSDILIYNPTEIIELTNGIITGGTNGKTFEEARRLIIYHGEHKDVLINPIDIEMYFNDNQYRIQKYKDNITDRVYYCYKSLTDDQNSIVPTTSSDIKITNTSYLETSSIKKQINDTVTIFPSTVYKYNELEQYCLPLTDVELDSWKLKTKEELIEIYNKNIYTRSPFHILLIPHDKYPEAIAFNLWDPKTESIWFKDSHQEIASQIVVKGAQPFHLLNGAGGYEVQLIVTKLGDLVAIPETDIKLVAAVKTRDGNTIIFPIEHYRNDGQNDIYKFNITTSYQLSKDSYLSVYYDDNILTTQDISLTSIFNIVCLVKSTYYPGITNSWNIISPIISSDLQYTWLGVSNHELTLNLGHELSDVLNYNVDIRWSPKVYETYEIDIPLLYEHDTYDSFVENNVINVTKTHNAGDAYEDSLGNQLYKHHVGDIKYNQFGDPILKQDRSVQYMIDILHIDNKIYVSENIIQHTFRTNLPGTLENIFDFLRTTHNILGELMQLYFKPTKTFGYGKFHIGDHVTLTLPLNMNFKLVYYVPKYVLNNQVLRKTIEDTSIRIVENNIRTQDINMTALAYTLKDAMPDYIQHIDVLGINNDSNCQTLIRLDEDIQPSLSQTLYLTEDRLFAVKKGLNIEFKDADFL